MHVDKINKYRAERFISALAEDAQFVDIDGEELTVYLRAGGGCYDISLRIRFRFGLSPRWRRMQPLPQQNEKHYRFISALAEDALF